MEIAKFIPTIILFCCFGFFIKAQEPHSVNYTTENGLPSNEVYCAYQDTTGYIWFGTDNGVSRYDGYTFENFGIEEGLDKLEINQIITDQNGKVWFSSYFGKVYYREGNQFCPYRYNHILEKYKNKSNLVNLQHIDSSGTFHFKINYVGILLIHQDGKEQLLHPDCGNCVIIVKTKSGFILSEGILDKVHKDYLLQESNGIIKGQRLFFYNDMRKNTESIWISNIELNSSNNSQAFNWNDSISLFSIYSQTYSAKDGILKPEMRSPSPVNIYFKDGPDLYIGHQKREGLHIYRNWTPSLKSSPEKWLAGSEVSWIFRDRNQGLWVTSINSGIFYYPGDQVKVYKSGEEDVSEKFTAVLPFGNGSAAGVSYDGNMILVKDHVNYKIIKIENRSNIHDLTQNEEFIFLRGATIDQKNKITYYKTRFPDKFEKKHKSELFYGSDRFYLLRYNPNTKTFDRIADEKVNTDFIWDMYRDHHNTLLLATNTGLKTFKDNKFENVIPVLQNTKTIGIDQMSTGQKVVGTKGRGIFILDEKKDNIANITVADGLSSDLIEYIWVDDSDDIWVATLKGLNKISIGKDSIPAIRQYHTYHGLPSEEILMMRTYGSEVWLATGKGLVYFRKDSVTNTTFKPELISFYVNGKVKNDIQNLSHEENNISITLKNYDFAMGAKVKYRYRFSLKNAWAEQSTNELNFINLAPEKYEIEVQAANKDGYWSESLLVPFTISKPWWLSWPFLIMAFFTFCFFMYSFYRSRIKRIRAEQQLKSQMLSYEKKALLAQMNPHFIFNAFSAIQYYINTDKTKKADDYLTDFSYLIRKILDNSSKKDILLSEEIKLIRLYTALEEKRFDQKFTTMIHIDEEIDTDATRVPCMLIQPLVENAINHGLMHLTERKGKLLISFADMEGALRIIVEDNGVGMIKSKDRSLHELHESYGLKLLHDRIASYSNSGEFFISLTQADITDNGNSAGTRFIIDIRAGQS